MKKIGKILLNAVPTLLMVALVFVVKNDYLLAGIYVIIILIAFAIKQTRHDSKVFLFGLIVMTICEYLFISTRVEIFTRNSLFGLMPIWLPLIWAYGFVAIKRGIEILNG